MKRSLLLIIATLLFAEGIAHQKSTEKFATVENQELLLDHYRSDKAQGIRPAVIFVFGGAFGAGTRDRDIYLKFYNDLLDDGWDVFAIDYRLGMTKKYFSKYEKMNIKAGIALLSNAIGMAVEDTLTATKYILDNAQRMEIDTTKLVLSGSSAGAITALQAEYMICNSHETASLLPQGFNYAGLISFAGAIFSTHGKPKWKSSPCPVMLFHGNSDSSVPFRKAAIFGIGMYGSQLLYEQFKKLNTPYYFHFAHYATHSMAVVPMSRNFQEVKLFLDKYILGGEPLQILHECAKTDVKSGKTKFSIKDYLKTNYKN